MSNPEWDNYKPRKLEPTGWLSATDLTDAQRKLINEPKPRSLAEEYDAAKVRIGGEFSPTVPRWPSGNEGQPTRPSPNPKELDSSHKIQLSLFPESAIIAGAQVLSLGNRKPGRTPFNWRENPIKATMYLDAIKRHLGKYFDGEDNDTEIHINEETGEEYTSPISHLDSAISSLAIMIDARECGTLIDDRPTKGGAAKFLKKITPKKKQ